ncbi:hypothetical protein SGRIM119S_02179 [Streptomyces griseorubiginosus]
MIAPRSGRYWYSEPTDTRASDAIRVVVSASTPSSTRMRSAASSTLASRARLRACWGVRRREAIQAAGSAPGADSATGPPPNVNVTLFHV